MTQVWVKTRHGIYGLDRNNGFPVNRSTIHYCFSKSFFVFPIFTMLIVMSCLKIKNYFWNFIFFNRMYCLSKTYHTAFCCCAAVVLYLSGKQKGLNKKVHLHRVGASLSLKSSLSSSGESLLEVFNEIFSYHFAQFESEVVHISQELILVKRTGLHLNSAPAKATLRLLPLASFW